MTSVMQRPQLADVCRAPGAVIDRNCLRFEPDQLHASIELLNRLQRATGSLVWDVDNYEPSGTPESSWTTLADLKASELKFIVFQWEREVRGARLNGGTATHIGDRVSCHFNTAQARFLREQGQWPG